MGSFFSELVSSKELEATCSVLQGRGRGLWLRGPAGVGKSTLIAAGLERAGCSARFIEGRYLADPEGALDVLQAAFGPAPGQAAGAGLSRWLAGALGTPRDGAALVLTDIDCVAPSITTLIMSALARAQLDGPVLVESVHAPPPEGLRSAAFGLLALDPLDDGRSELLLRALNPSAPSLPPQLPRTGRAIARFAVCGATSAAGWLDWLERTLDAKVARYLVACSIAESPLQRSWADRLASGPPDERAVFGGAMDDHGRIDPLLVHAVQAGQRFGRHVARARRELLSFLLAQDRLQRVDMRRAAVLCRQVALPEAALKLLQRHVPAGDSSAEVLSLQPWVRAMAQHGELRRDAARVLERNEPVSVAAGLQVHAILAESDRADERALADACLVRAAVWSGRRELSPEVHAAWTRVKQAPSIPRTTLRQLAALLLFQDLFFGSDGDAKVQKRLAEFNELCDDARISQAFERYVMGVQRGGRLDFEGAVETLQEAVTLAVDCGDELAARTFGNSRDVYLFLCGRFEELGRQVDASLSSLQGQARLSGHHWLDYPQLYRVMLDWQAGSYALLHDCASALPARLPQDDHPLVPRPHYRDFHPFIYGAIRDVAIGAEPDPTYVDACVEALCVLRPTLTIGYAGGLTAVHNLLFGKLDACEHLSQTLLECSPSAAIWGQVMLGLSAQARGPADPESVLQLLDTGLFYPDPYAAAYLVLAAAVILRAHGLDTGGLRERLGASPRLVAVRAQPAALLRATRAALEASGVSGAAPQPAPEADGEVDADTYVFVQEILARRFPAAPGGSKMPAHVQLLKDQLDERWFEPFRLESFSEHHGLRSASISRSFKRAVGVSPKTYQINRRLNEARMRLVETDHSLTTLAHELGFYDLANFSRVFRERTGLSPEQFRRRWG